MHWKGAASWSRKEVVKNVTVIASVIEKALRQTRAMLDMKSLMRLILQENQHERHGHPLTGRRLLVSEAAETDRFSGPGQEKTFLFLPGSLKKKSDGWVSTMFRKYRPQP